MLELMHTSTLKHFHENCFREKVAKIGFKPCLRLETASLTELSLDVEMATLHPSVEISGKQQI